MTFAQESTHRKLIAELKKIKWKVNSKLWHVEQLTNGKNPSFLLIHIRAGYQLKYVVV